jgi:hypothetical protein
MKSEDLSTLINQHYDSRYTEESAVAKVEYFSVNIASQLLQNKLMKLWLYELLVLFRCKCEHFYKINTNEVSCGKLVHIQNILGVSVYNIY